MRECVSARAYRSDVRGITCAALYFYVQKEFVKWYLDFCRQNNSYNSSFFSFHQSTASLVRGHDFGLTALRSWLFSNSCSGHSQPRRWTKRELLTAVATSLSSQIKCLFLRTETIQILSLSWFVYVHMFGGLLLFVFFPSRCRRRRRHRRRFFALPKSRAKFYNVTIKVNTVYNIEYKAQRKTICTYVLA